jgi:hypothetical protein
MAFHPGMIYLVLALPCWIYPSKNNEERECRSLLRRTSELLGCLQMLIIIAPRQLKFMKVSFQVPYTVTFEEKVTVALMYFNL